MSDQGHCHSCHTRIPLERMGICRSCLRKRRKKRKAVRSYAQRRNRLEGRRS